MKNVIKEIFIMLLLCVAIALVLAVVFYEYNPINKEIPETITYQMPSELSDVKEEIDTPLSNNEEQVIRTYELTEDDLEKTNYDAGKVNPFAAYSEEADNTVTNGTTNNTTNTSNNTTNKTDTNSTGSFFTNQSGK